MRRSVSANLLLSLALMIAGFVVALVGALADILDIGTGEGFGYYQLIVVIIGIILFLIGIAIQLNQRAIVADREAGQFEPEP